MDPGRQQCEFPDALDAARLSEPLALACVRSPVSVCGETKLTEPKRVFVALFLKHTAHCAKKTT